MSYPEERFTFGHFILGTVVIVGTLFLCTRGYSVDDNVALQAAKASGYTEPRVVDRHNVFPSFNGCSGSDAVGFDVEAKNSQGEKVRLLICSGWIFKASTVRIP